MEPRRSANRSRNIGVGNSCNSLEPDICFLPIALHLELGFSTSTTGIRDSFYTKIIIHHLSRQGVYAISKLRHLRRLRPLNLPVRAVAYSRYCTTSTVETFAASSREPYRSARYPVNCALQRQARWSNNICSPAQRQLCLELELAPPSLEAAHTKKAHHAGQEVGQGPTEGRGSVNAQ